MRAQFRKIIFAILFGGCIIGAQFMPMSDAGRFSDPHLPATATFAVGVAAGVELPCVRFFAIL